MGEIDAAHREQAQIWCGDWFGVHPDSRGGAIAQLATDTRSPCSPAGRASRS